MYKSLIRPILEYATPVWNPYLKKDIERKEIEHVQRKITKRISGLDQLTYIERLQSLHLPKLDTRRTYFELLECYKIVHKITRCECVAFLSLSELRTRGYHYKLKAVSPPARLDVRRHFFLDRTVSQWNALPAEIVQQESYSRFKSLLRKHLSI